MFSLNPSQPPGGPPTLPWTESPRQTGWPTDASDQPLPIGWRLEEFEVLGMFGQGGGGVVYRAHDHSLDRTVAIKEYFPRGWAQRLPHQGVEAQAGQNPAYQAGLAQFVREGRALARAKHPRVSVVHRLWHANGSAYLALPYHDGPTLAEARASWQGPPPWAWASQHLPALLEAVSALHASTDWHRDLHPENILCLPDGPMLIDLGNSGCGEADDAPAWVKAGYSPPEQYRSGPPSPGPHQDVYSLGGILYFLLEGQAPVAAPERHDERLVWRGAIPDGYPPGWRAAIEQALALQEEKRPPTVKALQNLLGLDPAMAVKVQVDPAPHLPQTQRRPRWPLAVALSLATAVGLASLWRDSVSSPANTGQTRPLVTTPASLDWAQAWQHLLTQGNTKHGLRLGTVAHKASEPGQRLNLDLPLPNGGWVYVLLWERSRQRIQLVFPNRHDTQNQMAPGTPLVLPRPGWHYVTEDQAPGWQALVLVSSRPRDFSDWPWDETQQMRSLDLRQTTGPKHPFVLSGRPVCDGPTPTPCEDSYVALGWESSLP